MITTLELDGNRVTIDLSRSHDLTREVRNDGITAWWIDPAHIGPVNLEGYAGSVAQGSATNFRNVHFNPHSHGTHTECLGHITEQVYSIQDHLPPRFMLCDLVSLQPEDLNGDQVITCKSLQVWKHVGAVPALAVRTLPLDRQTDDQVYSHSNPCYWQPEAMQEIMDAGVEHILYDQPSVDREEDGGVLACHNLWWGAPRWDRKQCTITELIAAQSNVPDGRYVIQIQVAPIENDAAPSRVSLFEIL